MAEINKICQQCGESFYKPYSISVTQWNTRKFCSKKCSATKHTINIKLITEDYQAGMSWNALGAKYNISSVHIGRILKSANVNIRNASERQKLSHDRPEVKEKFRKISIGRKLSEASKDKLRNRIGSKNHNWRNGLCITAGGYLQFTASKANGEHAGRLLHIIICEHKYKRSLRDGEHVHHIDNNKLNNHPDNLII